MKSVAGYLREWNPTVSRQEESQTSRGYTQDINQILFTWIACWGGAQRWNQRLNSTLH